MSALKDFGKRLVNRTGFDIRKLQPAASHLRPIGEQASVFADFKARGFTPAVIFDIGAATGTLDGGNTEDLSQGPVRHRRAQVDRFRTDGSSRGWCP